MEWSSGFEFVREEEQRNRTTLEVFVRAVLSGSAFGPLRSAECLNRVFRNRTVENYRIVRHSTIHRSPGPRVV